MVTAVELRLDELDPEIFMVAGLELELDGMDLVLDKVFD